MAPAQKETHRTEKARKHNGKKTISSISGAGKLDNYM